MDVGVEAAGGEDLALAGDHFGAGTDDDGDVRLNVGIAGLADGENIAVLDADVGLHDPPMVDNERIGDHRVDGARPVGDLRLAHAVADHLAAAEFHLLAVNGEILLDLDDEIGIGEPDAVSGGGTEHVGIDGTRKGHRHWCTSSHKAERGQLRCIGVESHGRGAAMQVVDLGDQPIGETSNAAFIIAERAQHGFAFGERVTAAFYHGSQNIDDEIAGHSINRTQNPNEFRENHGVNEGGIGFVPRSQEACRTIGLSRVVDDNGPEQNICIDADHPVFRRRCDARCVVDLPRAATASPSRRSYWSRVTGRA